MCDKELILEMLENIERTLGDILEWTECVISVDDFPPSCRICNAAVASISICNACCTTHQRGFGLRRAV